MSEVVQRLEEFVAYAKKLDGDEKGEAQVFCDRLFQAFGHDGYKEAGATLEFRIKKADAKGVNFADLVWKPRLLLEMKRGGTKLFHYYKQAFNYWIHAVPNRPRYVVLCNFNEFSIYDFDKQIDQPVDVVKLEELPKRYTALNFLFPEDKLPQFGNDREAVSREAADKIAELFKSLVTRGIEREQAQRFVLQLVVSLFSEDIDLLPAGTILGIAQDCLTKGQSSYDLFKGLFEQMNRPTPASGGRYMGVRYFNGGLFASVNVFDLTEPELQLIGGAEGVARSDWSKVNPAIFGTIFQQSMGAKKRHAYGAHFTHEADILRVVDPTIVQPWMARIAAATSMKELVDLRKELFEFRVLDPACGSGNFLYMAYRELVRVEIALLEKLRQTVSKANFEKNVKALSVISPKQFYGIDLDSFGVELAKVTLMLAKKLALDEATSALERDQIELGLEDDALPLDNLDSNIVAADALLHTWPKVDAIVGNPPYQSKNKAQEELGRAYLNEVRARYFDVPGRADYCVFWFRRAHDELAPGKRAGLVGTNTVRQNYSRQGGLDYIVNNGGTIVEAVSTMKWSGEAAVDVSIVNWIKGDAPGKKRLFEQSGGDPTKGWRFEDLDRIGPALSFEADVTTAKVLATNARVGNCFQGQTHGHKAFLLTPAEAEAMLKKQPKAGEVIYPFLIANDLIGRPDSLPGRFVIDFGDKSLFEAQAYTLPFERVLKAVLPAREKAAKKEAERNKAAKEKNPKAQVNRHHEGFLNHWWRLSFRREDMLQAMKRLTRYIACGQVTLRPIFEFIDLGIRPNAALIVFPFEDDYSFGILQSGIHWAWFTNRCSTLTGRPRYTSNTVFDSFPWPQAPSSIQIAEVAKAAVDLRRVRYEIKNAQGLSFRAMYRLVETAGESELKKAQRNLDQAVRGAYGITADQDPLPILFALNADLAAKEAAGIAIQGPGLPASAKKKFVTPDRLSMPKA